MDTGISNATSSVYKQEQIYKNIRRLVCRLSRMPAVLIRRPLKGARPGYALDGPQLSETLLRLEWKRLQGGTVAMVYRARGRLVVNQLQAHALGRWAQPWTLPRRAKHGRGAAPCVTARQIQRRRACGVCPVLLRINGEKHVRSRERGADSAWILGLFKSAQSIGYMVRCLRHG